MNPSTIPSAPDSISAAEVLSALQRAWLHDPAQPQREPLRSSFLNLRAVPQIPFSHARSAFPMVEDAYPGTWRKQIRHLRSQFTAAQAEAPKADTPIQILSFTSLDNACPRYGTTANLALAMASVRDMRVLVIDAQFGRPTLHEALGAAPGPGLCEATRADRVGLPSCFRRVTGTQTYFLTIGEIRAYPDEPIELAAFHTLLHNLRPQFDWIFIDAPSFSTPEAAMAISLATDGVIMIIESGRDSFRQVSQALRHVQCRRLLGAVMY